MMTRKSGLNKNLYQSFKQKKNVIHKFIDRGRKHSCVFWMCVNENYYKRTDIMAILLCDSCVNLLCRKVFVQNLLTNSVN